MTASGKEEGLQQQWYENGQLKQEVTFANGKREGIWQRWDEGGEPAGRYCYKAGEETYMSYCTKDKQS